MTDDEYETRLLLRLVGGAPAAADEVIALAAGTASASVLAVAALLSNEPGLLTRAHRAAGTPRERQLVALAEAHLHGRDELLDGLVRDHLADHPDHLLAAWIAGRPMSQRRETT
jgi:hypothetical protein